MADKLDWINQNFVLLTHADVKDVIEQENYKLPFELRELSLFCPKSDDFIKKLAVDNKYKQAIEFLSYDIHHRALAWWGYCSVLSLRDELEKVPPVDVDIESIGKPKAFNIPDWAKEPAFDPNQEIDKAAVQEAEAKISELKAKRDEYRAKIPKDVLDYENKIRKIIDDSIKDVCGFTLQEFFDDTLEKAKNYTEPPLVDETKSPIFKAREELKAKIEKIRQETIMTIKMAVPSKSKEEIEFQTSKAIEACKNFIIAPTDTAAKLCMDLGNTCPDTPEGMLCLICFWSYGNLMPCTDQVIKTPNGLAANGFNSLILMCALAKGGERTFAERMQHYFEIGREVGFGSNNWSDHLTDGNFAQSMIETDTTKSNSVKPKVEEKKIDPPEFKRFKGF